MEQEPGLPDGADDVADDRDEDEQYVYEQGAGQPYEAEPVLSGSVRYGVPEIALGHDLGQATAHGSPQARRRAKIIAWVVIVSVVLPFVLLVVFG